MGHANIKYEEPKIKNVENSVRLQQPKKTKFVSRENIYN